MALPSFVTDIETIPEALREHYSKGESGVYSLDMEDAEKHPVIGAALRSRDHEKAEGDKAKKAAKSAQTALEALQAERDELLSGHVPKDHVERLDASYKAKLAKVTEESAAQVQGLHKMLESATVDAAARSIADEISTAPRLLAPHIRRYLGLEIGEGKYQVRVLDDAGAPSAATLEDLKKSIAEDPEFSAIIIASRGSGGESGSAEPPRKSATSKSGGSAPNLLTMSREEKRAYIASKVGE